MNIIKKIINNNYSRGRSGFSPKVIVLHTYDGAGTSLYNWFNKPTTQASAHFGIFKDGTIEEYVEESDTAWGNGTSQITWLGLTVPNINLISISIEHQDDNNPQDSVRTPQQYESSAQLVAYLCKKYNIPCSRSYVIRHREVPGTKKSCPGGLDIDKIVARANEILGIQIMSSPAQTLQDSEFFTLPKGGWRSEAVQQIIDAGIWTGTWQSNIDRFSTLNPTIPNGGYPAGYKVRIKESVIPIPVPIANNTQNNNNNTTMPDTINLAQLQQENQDLKAGKQQAEAQRDQITIEFKNYKDEVLQKLDAFELKYNDINTQLGNATQRIGDLETQVSNLTTQNTQLVLERDNAVKERDLYKAEADVWKGKASSGQITVNDLPNKWMAIWQAFEARYGQKITYTLTESLPVAVTAIVLWLASYLDKSTPQTLVGQYPEFVAGGYIAIRAFIIGWLKDKNTPNKIVIEAAKLINPNSDPYNLRDTHKDVLPETLQPSNQ